MDIMEILAEKIKREYEAFCCKMEKLSQFELVRSPEIAHQLVFKHEINDLLQGEAIRFSQKTAELLMSQNNAMEYLYDKLCEKEQLYMDRVIDAIEDLNPIDED